MSDPRHDIHAASNDAAAVAWFISFGDLLTLLVCFFLVLTPWQTARERGKDSRKQEVALVSARSTGAGTWLAYRPLGAISLVATEIPLFEVDFQAATTKAESGALATIKQELTVHGAHARSIEVVVCEANRYPELFELLGSLRRELRVGREGAHMEMRATCEDFEILRPVTSKVIGRVRVVRG